MNEQEMLIQVLDRCAEQAQECECGILALSNDGRGIALIAPRCLIYSQVFHPAIQPFDLVLN
jgi:hypothetical protein